MKKGRIDINNYWDLLDIMSDIVDDFLEDFPMRVGLTCESEYEEFGFQYTEEGMRLYDAYERRLKKIFHIHFPDEGFNLRCSNMLFL